MERTLIVIKPDAVRRGFIGNIIQRFEKKGFVIERLEMMTLDDKMASRFYSVHKDKPFFGELVEFITSGPVVACILQGDNAIPATRTMVGSTKSYEAAPGSIRGDLSLLLSENAIHASDSQESFTHESGVVFP